MVAAQSPGLVWLLKHRGDPREPWQRIRIDALITSHHVAWADIDGDGDIDIVTGNFSLERSASPWIDVWQNQSKAGQKAESRRQRAEGRGQKAEGRTTLVLHGEVRAADQLLLSITDANTEFVCPSGECCNRKAADVLHARAALAGDFDWCFG